MIRILLGILLGGAIIGVGTVVATLAIGEMMHVSQAEGAFAMGVIFMVGPAAAVVGAIIGGVIGARSARRARTGSGDTVR